MRKIHESDFPLVIPKGFYLLISVSVVFVLFSVVTDLILIIKGFNFPFFVGVLPFICNGLGFIFGILAKEKARNYQPVSKEGCLADAFIFGNVIMFILNIVFICGLGYLMAQSLA